MQEGGETWGTYLVEHYGPGSSAETLRGAVRDVRWATAEIARQGRSIRFVRATIVPGDEAFMATFEAASEASVREAYERAGVELERISPAIQADDADDRQPPTPERPSTSTRRRVGKDVR